MSWKIKDEFIDLARARHTVIFHNSDTGAEHHLIHEFNLQACPHCGHPHINEADETIDFEQTKTETLTALHAHHRKVMAYRTKHQHVPVRNGPK